MVQVSSGDLYSVSGSLSSNSNNFQSFNAQQSADALVLGATFDDDAVEVGTSGSLEDLYTGLTVTAKQIVDKLNELLKEKLPQGLQSLKLEEVTPEKTAERVVTGISALFNAFAKQNSDLSPEELVNKFLEQATKGVEQGYGEAKGILQGLGALDIDGVEDSISSTKDLILKKLGTFAEQKLEELTGKATEKEVTELTKNEVLKVGGYQLLDLAA